MSPITYRNVSKRFGDVVAVEDLTLDIADGEFLVFLGPSGCGKSTALRLLAGLDTPTTGTISIGDEVVNDIDARHRDVAMVFQSYALYPHMTVAKNIESPLIGRRSEQRSKEERGEAVARTAAMLGLSDLLDRKPAQLSGGQRQRVALARAIVRNPAVFLMDEPLSNLDAKLRSATRTELVALHAQLGATFVYVTHDQVEAMTMATKIAVIDKGRLQQVATPRMLYDEPANVFVARFIGTPPMNIVPGELWPGTAQGAGVVVGVRPEDLVLTAGTATETGGERDADGGGLTGTIIGAEWLGHEEIIEVDVSGTRVAARHADGVFPTRVGATVRVTAAVSDLHLFDAATGDRLDAREPGPQP